MANDCLAQVQACRMRVSRLEPNGVPDPGANNLYVSTALITATLTPVYADGDEVEQKNACGDVCVNFKGSDSFKRIDFSLQLCTPDPELTELLAGGSVLTSGAAVGWAFPATGSDPTPNGVSIELWAKRITSDGSLAGTNPYAWWVLPRVHLRVDAATFENGPHLPTFSGRAVENSNWFNGPLNDWPLPAASARVAQWIPTAILPGAQCGYQTIVAS